MGTESFLETRNPCSGISVRTLLSLSPHTTLYPLPPTPRTPTRATTALASLCPICTVPSGLISRVSFEETSRKTRLPSLRLVTVLGNQIRRLPAISVQPVRPDSQVEELKRNI